MVPPAPSHAQASLLVQNNIGQFSWRRDLYDVCNIGGHPLDAIYFVPTPEKPPAGYFKLLEHLVEDEKAARRPLGIQQVDNTLPAKEQEAKGPASAEPAAQGGSYYVGSDVVKAMGLSVSDVITILPRQLYSAAKIETALVLAVVARDEWEFTSHTPIGNRQGHQHSEGTCNIFIPFNGSFEIQNQSQKEVIVVVKMQGA